MEYFTNIEDAIIACWEDTTKRGVPYRQVVEWDQMLWAMTEDDFEQAKQSVVPVYRIKVYPRTGFVFVAEWLSPDGYTMREIQLDFEERIRTCMDDWPVELFRNNLNAQQNHPFPLSPPSRC